jgi:hypothetical protein
MEMRASMICAARFFIELNLLNLLRLEQKSGGTHTAV